MRKKVLVSLLAMSLLTVSVLSGCNKPSAGTNAAKKEDPKYPVKPIEYIVPYAAGGGTDLVARAVAEYVSKEWGSPINVVNKPGAGGATGVQEALKAKNDGYTVLAANVSGASALIAGSKSLPIKLEDFLFMSQVVVDPLVFVVKDDAPWKDFKEFSEWAKNNPEKLTYATSGPTAIATFGVAEWMDAIGGDFSKTRMVVTSGAADSIPKVAGGHVVLAVQALGESSTLVKAGKVKMIAVASSKKSQYFPNVPTTEEFGIKMSSKWWAGVAAPKGTPEYITKKWEDTLAKMSKDPAFFESLKKISAEAAYLNANDFKKYVTDETAKFTDIATKKGLRK